MNRRFKGFDIRGIGFGGHLDVALLGFLFAEFVRFGGIGEGLGLRSSRRVDFAVGYGKGFPRNADSPTYV
jgi:hypothetical protein